MVGFGVLIELHMDLSPLDFCSCLVKLASPFTPYQSFHDLLHLIRRAFCNNVFHRRIDRLDTNECEQRRSQQEQEQEGSEVRSVELERLLVRGSNLIERRQRVTDPVHSLPILVPRLPVRKQGGRAAVDGMSGRCSLPSVWFFDAKFSKKFLTKNGKELCKNQRRFYLKFTLL
ncbi:hypothetical protein [uncultured Methylobacterium sp.]|uniref:hypothetical protein n=1 Tax=uncultured Methylobacterium sp. TaxID=157278 RepID=UPI0035CCA707